jgi:hypothetical protein
MARCLVDCGLSLELGSGLAWWVTLWALPLDLVRIMAVWVRLHGSLWRDFGSLLLFQ